MATSQTTVAAGVTTAAFPVLVNQNLIAGTQVQGGTVQISVGSTQSGPFTAIAAAGTVQSYRSPLNVWATVTTATQAATVLVTDITPTGQIINMTSAIDSANSTSEQTVFTFRIPPSVLGQNFRCQLSGKVSMTNSANAKTLQCRVNGLTGTLFHQSPALASLADYNFIAEFAGAGDSANLKGFGAGSAGGVGTSTTAYTSLALAYQSVENEVIVSVTKATGTETMKLESLIVNIF